MIENQTRIDDAIDRAVRDIMRRDPPAGLRGRVLSRLEASARRSPAWPVLATAAAGLAIVAMSMTMMLREAPSAPPTAPQPVASAQPAPVPSHAGPRLPTGAAVPGRPSRPAPRREPVRTATFGPRDGRIAAANLRSATAGDPDAVAVPPGDDMPGASPPAIVVDALAPPRPLDIAPIVVTPIEIPRIRLAPVPPPR